MDYIEKDLDDDFNEDSYPDWLAREVRRFIEVYNEYYEKYGKDEHEDSRN